MIPSEDVSVKVMTSPVAAAVEDSPQNSKPSNRNVYLATLAAQLFIISMGVLGAYSSPACADMQKPGSRFVGITYEEISWIASLPMLSGMFGNALSGYVSHRFGRQATLMYLSVPFTFGWLMIAYAPTVPFVYVGRILSGISTGMCTVAVPAYVVEISTVKIRGFLTSTFQMALSLGMFTVTGFGIILRWSWLAILGAVVVSLSASLLCFMPESPPWLMKMGRRPEAMKGLEFLRGKNYNVLNELNEIAKNIQDEPKGNLNLKEFLNPCMYKPLIIAIILSFNMAFCGFTVLLSYSVDVFKNTGSSLDANVAATIVVMVQMLSTVVSSLLMDKAGRRILYIVSGCTMTVSLTIFGMYSYLATKYDATDFVHWNWIPILCMIIYLAAYSLGFGSVPFVVVPELVPTSYRSFVMAVSSVIGSLLGFISIKIFDDMRHAMGFYGTCWFYGLVSLLGTIYYWFFIPETKGRTIHDINQSFSPSTVK